MDTDSFLSNLNGIEIFDGVAIGPLAKFMDLNNFDMNHASYNVANRGILELFKSETGSFPIKDSICL